MVPWRHGCISFDSYIKPQQTLDMMHIEDVVYLLNPTSNHNSMSSWRTCGMLYIFWILHQTTTTLLMSLYFIRCISFESYIKPQLLCFSGLCLERCISFESYIKPQHRYHYTLWATCCISFESYIKPQPKGLFPFVSDVVYLLNPTSNHNPSPSTLEYQRLYIFWILHQTTTLRTEWQVQARLYIFWILHQTTTVAGWCCSSLRCISFESYIKPQQKGCV